MSNAAITLFVSVNGRSSVVAHYTSRKAAEKALLKAGTSYASKASFFLVDGKLESSFSVVA